MREIVKNFLERVTFKLRLGGRARGSQAKLQRGGRRAEGKSGRFKDQNEGPRGQSMVSEWEQRDVGGGRETWVGADHRGPVDQPDRVGFDSSGKEIMWRVW